MLGGVADRVAHVVQAAAVHQVDDELQLVQALEVGDLRLIAGLDQRLEPGLDERADAAAQDGLLAEQIGFGFFGERRFEDPGAGAAERARVGQRQRARLAGGVLVHGEQAGVPPPSTNTSRTRCPGDFGATIATSTFGRRSDRAVADVEAVGEHQHLAGCESLGDGVAVDRRLRGVGRQQHHDVGPARRLGDRRHSQAVGARLVARLAGRRQPDRRPSTPLSRRFSACA